MADDFGRFEANPSILASTTFPLRNGRLKLDTVGRWLQELIVCEHVRTYASRGNIYGYFVNWQDHQGTPRAKQSKFPDPPPVDEIICEQMQANAPGFVYESEDRVSNSSIVSSSTALRGFDEFWSLYPKKVGKGAAERAWAKIRPDEQLRATIQAAIQRAMTSADWVKDSGQYIPHPATWLNQKRWEDEPMAIQKRPTSLVDLL